MKILVTGATGVVGRRLMPILVRAGHEVRAVARSREKADALRAQGVKPVALDLFSPDAVERAVPGMDAVINLATSIPPASRAFLPWAWKENNRIRHVVSGHIVDAAIAAKVPRVIQESFAPIYIDGGDAWLDENTPVKPVRYNRAIVDAEHAVERFTRAGGTGVVLRFAMFYGPDSGFTADMIRWAKKGRAAAFGSPDGYISSVSHDDAAAAVAAALSAPAGIYNVVDDEPVTRRAFYSALAASVGAPPPKFFPVWMKYLVGSMGELLGRSQRISNRKLKSATSWTPRYPSVREGFATLSTS
jgi:nucleoside-diphosphate-sugar epimerase